MTTLSPSTMAPELLASIEGWYEAMHEQPLKSSKTLASWLGPYSEVHRLEFATATRTDALVCKRIIDDEQNRIYRGRGSAAQIEFDALRYLSQDRRDADRCSVPTAHALFPQFDAFVMDMVPGESVEACLPSVRVTAGQASLRRAIKVFRSIGRWLHGFQALDQQLCEDSSALDQTWAHCDDRLKMIERERNAGVPTGFRSHVLSSIQAWTSRIEQPIHVGNCHGDFGPWNQLVDGDRLTVIDFFAYRRDCLLTDPLDLLIYLESQRHAPSFSSRKIRRLQDAFLQGFNCQTALEPELRLVCEAHHRIRRIHDCLMQQASRWSDRYRASRILRDNLQWFYGGQPLQCIHVHFDREHSVETTYHD